MLKLSVLTIILCLSPIFGLLETLFQSQNNCHSTCSSNYGVDVFKLNACKKGCEFKLHDEDCSVQCNSVSIHERIQASCLFGCLSDYSVKEKALAEPERSPSIILIRLRLRQHPLNEPTSLNIDPIRMFMNRVKEIRENSNRIGTLNDIKHDSSNQNNEYKTTHFIVHRPEKTESVNNPITQLFDNARSGWNNLIHKQPKITIYICISILFLSAIILLYMIVSLYHHTPINSIVSVDAEEFLDNEYDKVLLSKEHDQYIESSPIKVQLSNV